MRRRQLRHERRRALTVPRRRARQRHAGPRRRATRRDARRAHGGCRSRDTVASATRRGADFSGIDSFTYRPATAAASARRRLVDHRGHAVPERAPVAIAQAGRRGRGRERERRARRHRRRTAIRCTYYIESLPAPRRSLSYIDPDLEGRDAARRGRPVSPRRRRRRFLAAIVIYSAQRRRLRGCRRFAFVAFDGSSLPRPRLPVQPRRCDAPGDVDDGRPHQPATSLTSTGR